MDIKGAVISADAMHCQTETAKISREGGADYSLQVKNNQKKLLTEIKGYFHKIRRDAPQLLEANHFQEKETSHGRVNKRDYRLLPITDWFDETSYYITSLKDDVETVAGYIRRHWAIENSQHWVLDVTFREDECQIYAEDGAKNLATVRRTLLNLVKEHPLKDSVAGKLQRACWDANFREEILFGCKITNA